MAHSWSSSTACADGTSRSRAGTFARYSPRGRPGSWCASAATGKGPLGGPVKGPLGGPVKGPLGGPVNASRNGMPGAPRSGPLGWPVKAPAGGRLGGPVNGVLGGPVKAPVGGAVNGPLGDPVCSDVRRTLRGAPEGSPGGPGGPGGACGSSSSGACAIGSNGPVEWLVMSFVPFAHRCVPPITPDGRPRCGCLSCIYAVTKSISSSTLRSRLVSRSAYVCTAARIRRHAALVPDPQPSAATVPSFHGVPRGTWGQPPMPSTGGLTACQMSTNSCPVISTCGELTWAAMRLSFDPATRWSTSTPSLRPGPG